MLLPITVMVAEGTIPRSKAASDNGFVWMCCAGGAAGVEVEEEEEEEVVVFLAVGLGPACLPYPLRMARSEARRICPASSA